MIGSKVVCYSTITCDVIVLLKIILYVTAIQREGYTTATSINKRLDKRNKISTLRMNGTFAKHFIL